MTVWLRSICFVLILFFPSSFFFYTTQAGLSDIAKAPFGCVAVRALWCACAFLIVSPPLSRHRPKKPNQIKKIQNPKSNINSNRSSSHPFIRRPTPRQIKKKNPDQRMISPLGGAIFFLPFLECLSFLSFVIFAPFRFVRCVAYCIVILNRNRNRRNRNRNRYVS